MCLFQLWFSQGVCPDWDYWVIWWFHSQFFKDSPQCLPQQLHQFTFPPTVQEGSLFSTPSPAFNVCRFFDDDHSDWYEVIPHCSFDFHLFNNERCLASFHEFISHLQVFFGEMSVQIFWSISDWVVSFSYIELYKLLVYFRN